MKDCWFVLLRSYVRLDQVKVRILDTRIFHQFEHKNRVIRDFTFLEETWENLRLKGFMFGSEWLLSPNQSDEIYSWLSKVFESSEIIEF